MSFKHPKTSNCAIIHRVVPHYRFFLFRALYRRTGIVVLASHTASNLDYLNLPDLHTEEFSAHLPIWFPKSSIPETAITFLYPYLRRHGIRNVIAEFGLRQSWVYELIVLRRLGLIDRLAFYTHGWQMGKGFATTKERMVQNSRLFLYNYADLIITYTKAGADWVNANTTTPATWVENTIQIGSTQLRQRALSSEYELELLSVGRMTSEKKQLHLIDITRHLQNKGVAVRLTIIGDGPEYSKIKDSAESSGIPLDLPGALYSEDSLAPYFRRSNLFVLTGAAGLSINHALAYGVPVVAYGTGVRGIFHHPEIAYVVDGVTGIIVSSESLEHYAQRVYASYASGDLYRMRESALSFYQAYLHPDRVVQNWLDVLTNHSFIGEQK